MCFRAVDASATPPQVGAASIDARLDCDAFASTHSATSHYDRASFVVRAHAGALALGRD